MLSNFVSKNRYLVKLIVMTLIGLVMLFDFITLFGSYSNQTGANAGVSFSFLASAALLGLLLFCMLSNKEDYAKMLGVLYLAYYVISILLSVGSPFYSFYKGNHGTFITASVFVVIANTCVVALVVLGVLSYLNGKSFAAINEILYLVFLCASVMAFIMYMAAYGIAKYDWTSFMNVVVSRLLKPCLAVLGYLYMSEKSTENQRVDEDTTIEDRPQY